MQRFKLGIPKIVQTIMREKIEAIGPDCHRVWALSIDAHRDGKLTGFNGHVSKRTAPQLQGMIVLFAFTRQVPLGTNGVLFVDGNERNCHLNNLRWRASHALENLVRSRNDYY